MPAFKRAVGFLQGRRCTAKHSSPKWCAQAWSASRNGARAVATDGDKYADGGTAAVVQRRRSIQRTGHGFADQRRYWSVHLGMDAQPVALQHEGLRLRVFKDPREGLPMPHLTEFFDNVQLPSMPDVARDLVATMQDDDIPFEKVRNAIARDPALTAKLIRLANSAALGWRGRWPRCWPRLGWRSPSPPPTPLPACLRKSSGRCHWTRTGWPNICRRWRTLWMCLCADAGRAKTCVSIHPKRKAPRGLSCVRA